MRATYSEPGLCMTDVTFVRIRIKAVELGVVDTGILLVVKRPTTYNRERTVYDVMYDVMMCRVLEVLIGGKCNYSLI